jgi:iron complex transport system ATP-binding protein
MDLFRTFVQRGGGALVVLHDVGLAARYADRLVWMHEGRIVADGRVEDTLKPDLLRQIYGVRATVDGRSVHIDGVA